MNPSTLWATIFIDELARNGLQAVVIAPGSRSTPLTMAFANEPRIKVYSLIDERGAAFFALGMALASRRPVALVCTSGTATANFFPAVIEAYLSQIPLLVLTADRPYELRDSGANQTINQVNLYGSHVRWFVDVALPEGKPADLTLRYLRTTACRAMVTAVGRPPGPVHLNFPFRKPLEPFVIPGEEVDLANVEGKEGFNGRPASQSFTTIHRGRAIPTVEQIESLVRVMQRTPRGLIICGPRCPGDEFPQAVAQLAQAIGYPILADATSGVRFGSHLHDLVLGGYNHYLPTWKEQPDLILRFGAMPTTKALLDFVENLPDTRHIVVSEHGVWEDAAHLASEWIWADSAVLCQRVVNSLISNLQSPISDWLTTWQTAEITAWETAAQKREAGFFEGAILAEVVEALLPDAALFVSSSLPVRHLDQFTRPNEKPLHVFANRGASGIDGTVSSALGVAAVHRPLVLVTGDLAFYHDLNGLIALKRCGVSATIVVINNNGGGIFRRLPVAQFDPPFTELFLTPHGLSFEAAARLFEVDYVRVTTVQQLREALKIGGETAVSKIIEVFV